MIGKPSSPYRFASPLMGLDYKLHLSYVSFEKTPPAKPAVIAAATEVSDALGELTESLWRISSFLASLGG